MTANVKFAKVRPDAKIPSKRDEDMGFDIYACFNEDYIVIEPHETKLIPTGIASACDSDYGFLVFERGSTGSKGIARRCGVIDSGYRNEWFIGLTNTTQKTLCITKLSNEDTKRRYVEDMVNGAKFAYEVVKKMYQEMMEGDAERFVCYPYTKAIAQALVVPVPKTTVEETSYEELQNIKSERGLGALGSSGK
jgi:dUTP pyrophosphatase